MKHKLFKCYNFKNDNSTEAFKMRSTRVREYIFFKCIMFFFYEWSGIFSKLCTRANQYSKKTYTWIPTNSPENSKYTNNSIKTWLHGRSFASDLIIVCSVWNLLVCETARNTLNHLHANIRPFHATLSFSKYNVFKYQMNGLINVQFRAAEDR